MIKSLHIENFRCFQKLDLNDLGRFNIIVGDNSAGKTVLLEALVMPGGRHDLVFRLRSLRGLIQPPFMPIKPAYEALWRDLFFKFSQSAIITISLSGTPENSRTLRIFYKSESPLLIGFQTKDMDATMPRAEPLSITPLTFETDVLGQKFSNTAIFASGGPGGSAATGLQITGNLPPPALIGFLPTLASYNLALQFSQIDVQKDGKAQLVAAIRKVFPIIEDLSVQSTAAGISDLYCTVPELQEKIPVALLSAGIQRFLAVLITIAAQANGVVLVDEIENGIFYENLGQAWRGIFDFCKLYNVQLFASTHSKECLEALVPFLAQDASEFRLLRTESRNGEGHSVRMFTGKDFRSALKVGIDPRKSDIPS